MTIEEKIQTMEMLWDDLCHQKTEPTSPHWHEDVLENRATNIANGTDDFVDWEEAKRQINQAIR